MKGRKRHIIVDSQGWLVRVLVHPANWADSDGARHLLRRVPLFTRWTKLLLDGGYDTSALIAWCWQHLMVEAEIVRRRQVHTFVVLPKRWVVERTFAWLGKYRRLSKDYEALPSTSESWVYVAMIDRMLHRLCS